MLVFVKQEVVKEWYGGVGKRLCLGFESLSLSLISLAKPMGWAIEYGFNIVNSLRMSIFKPEMKQLSIVSGVRPTTQLHKRSNLP